MADYHAVVLPKVSNTKHQNTVKENTLSDAKDRAQLTATTAMSVVHVALLRSVLNTGPAKNKYYTPVLILISISLALQVVAGTLALLISHLRSYYQKHNEDSCTNFWSNVCCCRIVCRRKKHPERTIDLPLRGMNAADGDNASSVTAGSSVIVPTVNRNNRHRQVKSATEKCCTCVCGGQMVNEDDLALMRKHSDLSEMLMDTRITAAEAKVQMEYNAALIQKLKADRHGSSDNVTADADQVIQEEINRCETAIKDYDSKVRLNEIIEGQYAIVQDAVDDMRKNYVLKRVSFWQHALNYMLYFIFIFNAFITGLGVSGNDSNN